MWARARYARPGRGRRGLACAVAAAVLTIGACARPAAPPGGPGDGLPPVVAAVEPDTFAVVEPGDQTLRLRFNERISRNTSQGTLASAVTVSPRTGEVSVSHDRMGLDISLEGGLQPGLVYRVAVAPVLEDMFNNPMAVPFEWVFSTGGEINPNVIFGQVWDATTGEPVEAAVVEVRRAALAEAAADTFPYVTSTDSLGIFVLRYLPVGALDIRAWQDLNRDQEVELTEPVWRQRQQIGSTDTLRVSHVPLLAGDTTWAEAVSAEVLDSLTIRVEFDDFLDPGAPIQEVSASLAPAVDSIGEPLEASVGAPTIEVLRLFHEAEFAQWADSVAGAETEARDAELEVGAAADDPPVADSAVAADTVLADTLTVESTPPDSIPPDSLAAEQQPEPAPRPRSPDEFAISAALDLLPNGRPIPQQTLVVRLAAPLPRGVPYDLTLTGVINLVQRAGGGGVVRIALEEIEPEDPPPVEAEIGR